MAMSGKHRQLFRIALGVNLLSILPGLGLMLSTEQHHLAFGEIGERILTFSLGNLVCWAVNLFCLMVLLPRAAGRKFARFYAFYLPSYILTGVIALWIAHTAWFLELSNSPLKLPVFGPLYLSLGMDTLVIVAIELILTKFEESSARLEIANMRTENAELRMKSLEAQHEKLKSQLHPHFLFNSLNALKSLIRKDPVLAENYLIKLSGFLRFSISHNEQNIVPLREELDFSLQYLEMQKVRFRDALTFSVDIPAELTANAMLPVFSLQLALENAVKHNKFTQEQPLNISIRYADGDWLVVANNIHEKLNVEPGSGTGLKNLSDRYRLLIQENIRVDIDDQFFSLYLKLIRA
jgi:hypothetical protein